MPSTVNEDTSLGGKDENISAVERNCYVNRCLLNLQGFLHIPVYGGVTMGTEGQKNHRY
jgi:hypothetical protein